jgi:NAD kinase
MDRIVIVTKPTRLEELIRQHMTEGAARFALESREQSIEKYQEEDAAYKAALSLVCKSIPNDLPGATVYREDLPNFLFRDKDLILVSGPDGLFVNLAKYINDQPVLSINPDPRTVAGVLMLFRPDEIGEMIGRVQAGKHNIEKLPLLKATIDDDRIIWAVNDLFIGRKDHVSALYELSFDGRHEHQSSSGIIVSTGVGSTGWIRSVATMITALSRDKEAGKLASLPKATSNELVYVVREPFPSPKTGALLITGRVIPGKPLEVISEMPNGGYVFSDGVVERAVEWNAGSRVIVTIGDRYVNRIIS